MKISSTKKGTAAGLSGESIDMLASLNPASSDLIRRVVNLMMRSRRAFSQWKRRAICPVPKIIGNPDVGLSRPITLLSVSGKVFWSVMSDRMVLIWKKHELLQRQQYGFRQGVSIDEPLIIATLAAEQCYDLRQPLITASQDISKAFDSVSRGLKALAFGRLGVPEEFCDMFAAMDIDNRTVVLTAYGTSETVLGEEGVFECARGYAQGCTTSANIGWTSFYDILLTLQHTLGVDDGTFRAIGDELGECDRSTMAFADDAFYMAGGPCTSSPRRSIELKLAVASLFFDFTGIKFNAQKTECCAMEWPEDATAFTTAENEGWCPWTYDLDVLFAGGELCLLPANSPEGNDHICAARYRRESIKMVPVPDGLRYLGVWSSPRLDTEITQRWVVETADEIIDRVRLVPVDAAATRFLLEQVLWAKVGYRLRYERFAVGAFDALERRVRELLLHRARLGVRMSKDAAAIPAVLGGPDIAAWRDLVMADRLRVVQRQLDENTTAAPLIRAAITRCQERFGSSQLVFESSMTKVPDWLEGDSAEHGWIESLAVWCSEKGIELRGGRGLPGAAFGDAAIVDLVQEDFTGDNDDADTLARKCFLRRRRIVQQAAFEMDQHFVSDFLLLDGHTMNLDAVHFVKNHNAVRSFLRTALTSWGSTPLPRFRGNDVKAGDTILVRSTTGGVQLAEVISVSGTDVRVDYLERAYLKTTKAVAVGDSVFAKRSSNKGVTYNWQPGKVTHRPRNKRRITVQRPSGLDDDKIEIKDSNLRVFVAEPREWRSDDNWTNTDATSLWVKSARQAVLSIGRAVRLPTRRFDCSGYFSLVIRDGEFAKLLASLDDLASSCSSSSENKQTAPATQSTNDDGDNAAAADDSVLETMRLHMCQGEYPEVVRRRCNWPGGLAALRSETTLFVSDGSYQVLGTGAWGLVTCRETNVDLFSGVVHPGCGTNSPYRSEAYGLLAGLRHAYETRIMGDILHLLDNKAVVDVFQNCETRGPSLVCSQDVWDEIIWYKRTLGPRYSVRWRRGHAEKRGALVCREDRANHLADGLAAAGYAASVDLRKFFTRGRRWQVRMEGLRPFDDIRSSARLLIGTQRLRAYMDLHQTTDGRDLNVDALRAMYGGQPSKSMWSRAENAKFVHTQLATKKRLRSWCTEGIFDDGCRACRRRGTVETVRHLLLSCRAADCVAARRKWFKSVKLFAQSTSARVADFLNQRLTMTPDGRLLCDDSEVDAFGLVTGFLPAGLRMALYEDACNDDEAARCFIYWLRKHTGKTLWRPTWEAAKEAGSTDVHSDDDGSEDDDDDDNDNNCDFEYD